MIEGNTASGLDENQGNDTAPEAEVVTKTELAEIKQEILNEIQKLNKSNPEQPKITEEEINALWAKNPAKAIELVIDKKVNQKTSYIENKITTDQSKKFWDAKAEADFPLILKDKKFKEEVKSQLIEFVREGEYTSEHPKAVYRAAQLVAMRYKGESGNDKTSSSGMSAEAPTSGTFNRKSSSETKHFNDMAKAFGFSNMSESLKKRAEAKYKVKRGE